MRPPAQTAPARLQRQAGPRLPALGRRGPSRRDRRRASCGERWDQPSQAAHQAKALSLPSAHPRRDGLVVYLGHGSWHHCHDVAEVARAGRTQEPTPPSSHGDSPPVPPSRGSPTTPARRCGPEFRSAPGRRPGTSSGRGGAAAPLPARAAEALREARIDPLAPYRNTDSPREEAPLPSDCACSRK
ncbi:T3SS effector HopA1 family protein [Streptomyces sp. NBC_01013]|uniref:T3SS effector HopA1 family protein n=1 Tax=Streptomyces sp. NBC_01013 TaxID=2903718 RepID=UPI00386707E6